LSRTAYVRLVAWNLPSWLRVSRAGSSEPAVVSPTGTYTDISFPPQDGGYPDFQWDLTVRTDPSPDGYFWSHQFGFVGGDQGYCGLQTHNAELGGKIAIFSIWSAHGSRGPQYAGLFGGEGTGFTARIRYEWQVDVTYRLTVRGVDPDPTGQWWLAEVTDSATGETAVIGEILVPGTWAGLNSTSVMWSERYAGPMRRCGDMAHSVVEFTNPMADGGRVAATGFNNHLANPPTCPNSLIEPLPTGSRQEMGVGSEPGWAAGPRPISPS
jgi:hypothetical protein